MGGWTASAVAASVALFLVAGVCEVGGGWLVWQACREVRDEGIKESSKSERERDHLSRSSPRQPPRAPLFRDSRLTRLSSAHSSYSLRRVSPGGGPWSARSSWSCTDLSRARSPSPIPAGSHAARGFFVALSVAWARAFDGFKPDVGDFIGCAIALIGAGVIVFYPRQGGGVEPGSSAVFPKLAAARETVY